MVFDYTTGLMLGWQAAGSHCPHLDSSHPLIVSSNSRVIHDQRAIKQQIWTLAHSSASSQLGYYLRQLALCTKSPDGIFAKFTDKCPPLSPPVIAKRCSFTQNSPQLLQLPFKVEQRHVKPRKNHPKCQTFFHIGKSTKTCSKEFRTNNGKPQVVSSYYLPLKSKYQSDSGFRA